MPKTNSHPPSTDYTILMGLFGFSDVTIDPTAIEGRVKHLYALGKDHSPIIKEQMCKFISLQDSLEDFIVSKQIFHPAYRLGVKAYIQHLPADTTGIYRRIVELQDLKETLTKLHIMAAMYGDEPALDIPVTL